MSQETEVLDLLLKTAMAWGKALPLSGLSFHVDDSEAKCSVMAQLKSVAPLAVQEKSLLFLPFRIKSAGMRFIGLELSHSRV